MDGMFYRRNQDDSIVEAAPTLQFGQLVILTVVVAVIVIGTLLALMSLGLAPADDSQIGVGAIPLM